MLCEKQRIFFSSALLKLFVVVYHSQFNDMAFFVIFERLYESVYKCVCELGHRTTAITGSVHLEERKMLYGMLCPSNVYGVQISFELVLEFIYFIYSTTNHARCALRCALTLLLRLVFFVLVFMVCVWLEK